MSHSNTQIIGLTGSPRANSNCTAILRSLLDGAKQEGANCEIIRLSELNIKPCSHCDHCRTAGECIFFDDMAKIYKKLKVADAVIIASPIYFMGLSSQLKLVVDRCQMFWSYRDSTKQSLFAQDANHRKGIFIATGARNSKNLFTGVKQTIKWVFETLECEFWDSILVGNCENPGDINKTPEILEQARLLGIKLAKSYNDTEQPSK